MNRLSYSSKTHFIRALIAIFLIIVGYNSSYGQVNLQTGSATFSLPMFDWKDNKSRLYSVVALNYNSGNGLKVNDVASNAGQGWSLIAGGSITRLQVGEPDDQVAWNGNGTEQDISKYPAGHLYANVPTENGCPEALTKYPIYKSKNQIYTQHNSIAEDKQLDYFSFQFNGKAGVFVLNKATGKGVTLGDNKMIISFQHDNNLKNQDVRTTITSFTIQDTDGLIYKFAQHEKYKVLDLKYCDENLNYKQEQPDFNDKNVYHQTGFENQGFKYPWVIGSWYLTEIEDALTHRKITFTYNVRQMDNMAGQDISYNSEDYAIITHKRSITQTPAISSISHPDGHLVAFTYGNPRADLKGDSALAAVDIKYQGRPISRYKLNTTYFILNRYGTPVSPFQKSVARLCLKSVQKIGVDLNEDTPPYLFDYYLGSNEPDDFVPPPFFYAKDIWGFFNGHNTGGYYPGQNLDLRKSLNKLSHTEVMGLCFMRESISGLYLNPKDGRAQNGLLQQIIYPTGGSLKYEYKQNSGKLDPSETDDRVVGGVHVSKTKSTDGGYSNDCANEITTEYKYILNDGGTSSLWGLEMPVNSVATSNFYEPKDKRYKWSLSNCGIFGCCYYKFMYPGILSRQQAINLHGWQKTMENLAPVLGIISVVTTIVDVVNLACFSTGFMAWAAVIVDVVGGLVTLGITCLHDYSQSSTTTVYYNTDLNGVSPLPAQFKRVEITGSPGGVGKTVHEFTSNDDYGYWVPSNPTFSAKQRFAPWAYGLPKMTTIFDNNGIRVKEIINKYNFWELVQVNGCDAHSCPEMAKVPLNLISCKCQVNQTFSQRSIHWNDPAVYNAPPSYRTVDKPDMDVDIYDFYTGRVELKSTLEKFYKTNDETQYVSTESEYEYHLENYQVKKITTTYSDGNIYYKDFKYSDDFNTGVLATLKQNNILAVPVVTTSSIYKVTGTKGKHILSEEVTEFTQLSNGNIKVYRNIEQRFKEPLLTSYYDPGLNQTLILFKPYLGPGNPQNSADYKQTQLFTYDALSNLIGLKDEGGRMVSNIYDYQDKYIVASVINADPLVDRPAYSSFESNSLGGWSLSGANAVYENNSGITGTRSFNLASKTFNRNINTAKVYILSFWANNNNVIVTSGATLVKSAPTLNGFTYYEYVIAQGTATVSVSGNALIDELRLFPKTARMRTVTYDPLIGKTAECDENNRITYYEYDNLGRMQFVKDDGGNIVKMYEYNNASKQNVCPGIYYNRAVSEEFAKSNCGPGYIGGTVPYTVPANKYSSTISQEDADARAENEILENGQATADATGNCIKLYYNIEQSTAVTTENCPDGFKGGTVTYTVPADRYSSTISQEDANNKALVDIAANAMAWANDPANAVCIIDRDPQWEWEEGAPATCFTVNGQLPAHRFLMATDKNPNSPTYGKTEWKDTGEQDTCPSNTYFSAEKSGTFTRNNCGTGYAGSTVTYTVPLGKYSSTESQAAADQQATIDYYSNGQAYANSNGTCTPTTASISATNSTSMAYTVKLASVSNPNVYYNFSVNGYQSALLGQVPSGIYNVTVSPIYVPLYNFSCQVGSYFQSGVGSKNFYNITVTQGATLYVSMY